MLSLLKNLFTASRRTNGSARLTKGLGSVEQKTRRKSFLESLEGRQLLAGDILGDPRIWTDQGDYAPGSTALISGCGYEIGEQIRLEVTLQDGTVQGTPDNPWTIQDGGEGD